MVIKGDKSLSPFAAPSETRSSFRQALPQILAVCVKNVLLLGFGMTLGFPTILIPSLSGRDPNEPISLGQEAISWIGSINLICVPVGCLLSGAITQPIGRKRAMQLVNIPFVIAWLLFYFSNDVWQIFLALCITGVTGGLLEAPTLTYVAEITQPSLRGILSSTAGVAVIFGILAQFLLGTFLSWRVVALVSCTAPISSFILLFFVPESPYWLILKKRHDEARKCIAWLRGWTTVEEIEPEFNELTKQISSSTSDKQTLMEKLKLFTKKNFFWPFMVVSFAFFLSQFSGTTPLQIYAVKIFSSLHAPIDEYYATVAMGVAEVLGCVLSTCLVHYTGKRVMNFFSLISCGICFLTVAIYAYINNINYLESFSTINKSDSTLSNSWLPMVFLIAAAFCTHTGIKLLPWMLIGEVYSNDTRATASGLSGAVSYILGFISIKIFLSLVLTITLPGAFWFYCAICFGGTVVLYFILPETEGKTLFEITEHFAGNSNLGNKTLTYVAEITQPSLRGILASTSTVAVISGILIQFLLGTFFVWRVVALLSCVVPIISTTLLFFVPESPHWLISKHRFLDARRSLAWLRGWTELGEIEAEFSQLCEQINQRIETTASTWRLYTKKNFLWPYCLVSFSFFLGHFSGMTTLQTYAVKIFSVLKAPIDKYYATISLGAAEVFGCILSACLVHYVGKRVMNFFSLIGCGFCFLIAATYIHTLNITNFESVLESTRVENTWIPTTLLILSAFFTHSGIRILPWMLIGEVYSNETRATASGLSGGLSYIFGFVSNKIFLKMVNLITLPGTFWLYSGVCFIGMIVLYFVLPETEGKTLFEITEHFAGNGKLDNQVHKKNKNVPNGEDNKGFNTDDERTSHESKL